MPYHPSSSDFSSNSSCTPYSLRILLLIILHGILPEYSLLILILNILHGILPEYSLRILILIILHWILPEWLFLIIIATHAPTTYSQPHPPSSPPPPSPLPPRESFMIIAAAGAYVMVYALVYCADMVTRDPADDIYPLMTGGTLLIFIFILFFKRARPCWL
ncbi:hypothetical protein T492DRAFT_121717 [Pavlovales sp. CCMP2436]|nr:hypothetical protein T492DRAFT_121717 [Pavlovales sp. CCMP2436]